MCSDGNDSIQEWKEQAESDGIQGLDEAIYMELAEHQGRIKAHG